MQVQINFKCNDCRDTGYLQEEVYNHGELDGYDEVICQCQLQGEDNGDEEYEEWRNNN